MYKVENGKIFSYLKGSEMDLQEVAEELNKSLEIGMMSEETISMLRSRNKLLAQLLENANKQIHTLEEELATKKEFSIDYWRGVDRAYEKELKERWNKIIELERLNESLLCELEVYYEGKYYSLLNATLDGNDIMIFMRNQKPCMAFYRSDLMDTDDIKEFNIQLGD